MIKVQVSVVIGADIAPTKSNYKYFRNADVENLIGNDLISILDEHCFRIFNLETPLTDTISPISKCGPCFSAPVETVNAICAMNPSLISLANNHILDQGEQGLVSTIKLLDNHKVPHVGVGINSTDAAQPYILEKDRLKIGVYSCTEHEFSIATELTAGANAFDCFESLIHIRNLKHRCDHVIVLYHGGKEYYQYPSPNLQKCCKKMVEAGADLVICQHSHCIGCFEKYNNSTIVYGQGNFLLDNSDKELWKTSLLVSAKFDGETVSIDYCPITKCGNHIRKATNDQASDILSAFYNRSEKIMQEGFIRIEYNKFAETMYIPYLNALHGDNPMTKVLTRITKRKIIKSLYSEEALLKILNYFECEAHKELLIASLKTSLNKVSCEF